VDIKIGSIVVSAAGHDKGGIFTVIGFTQERYALIADGKVRKLEKPKKKKLKHLKPIGELDQNNPIQTNRQLRAVLKKFNTKSGQGR
jgi:ribosomal protein L14E/L6E/L27E